MAKYKVILDTDFGTDVDDAFALAYMLAHPDVEVLGVVCVTGEALERAQLASALCIDMGQPDIPIYTGLETCILRKQYQYECPQKFLLNKWPHRPASAFPKCEGLNWMRRTIRENPGEVILCCIGPLSDPGILFQIDPELPSLLRGLQILGGRFQYNQFSERRWLKKSGSPIGDIATMAQVLDWNTCIDGIASAMVADPSHKYNYLRFVGDDMTMGVFMSREEFNSGLAKKLPPSLVDMANAWVEIGGKDFNRPVVHFHDAIGVSTNFNPNICDFLRGTVSFEMCSPTLRGFNTFEEDPEGPHEIAVAIHPQEFFKEFTSVFR